MKNYTYSIEDFSLKRKYFLTNEYFELKKIKCENNNFIFINTELPSLLYINKESPIVSNFNIKDCQEIKSINSLENLYFSSEKISSEKNKQPEKENPCAVEQGCQTSLVWI